MIEIKLIGNVKLKLWVTGKLFEGKIIRTENCSNASNYLAVS